MTIFTQSVPSQVKQRTTVWLQLAIGWHGLVTLAGLSGLIALFTPAFATTALWLKLIAGALLLADSLGSGVAAVWIARRDPRGRLASLAVTYLTLLASLLADLHLLGIFIGLDALADTFGRGLPFLGVALLGYLIGTWGDRYENQPQHQHRFQTIGRWVLAAGFALFFFAVGGLPALSWLAGQFVARPITILLSLIVILCGVMVWAVWQPPMAEALHASHSQEETLNGYLFLSPNLLGFLIFFAGPLLLSLYVSFTNWDAFGTRDWIGFTNYARMLNITLRPLASPDQLASAVLDVRVYDELARFTFWGNSFLVGAEDRLFWIALGNTLKFCLLAVPLSVIPALVLAAVLNSKLPGMRFYRAIYFIPSIAAVVGISLVWQWMYNAAIGWINYFITLGIGALNGVFGAAIADPQIRWLSSVDTALMAVVIVAAWQTTGFNSVLFLAGLQNIPGELYEAATVDGAGAWHKFWSLTLPLLAPTTFFVVSTTTIQALQAFEQIYILTNPPGSPNNSTLTMVVYLYQRGFQDFQQGYASAVAWVLFFVIFVFTLAQFQRQRQTDIYES